MVLRTEITVWEDLCVAIVVDLVISVLGLRDAVAQVIIYPVAALAGLIMRFALESFAWSPGALLVGINWIYAAAVVLETVLTCRATAWTTGRSKPSSSRSTSTPTASA